MIRTAIPSSVLLVIAGGADMSSGIFRSTMWNQTIPPDVRGRMAGIEMLSYSIGPLLGQVRSSAAASPIVFLLSFRVPDRVAPHVTFIGGALAPRGASDHVEQFEEREPQ